MPTTLDRQVALVVIDLQKAMLSMPTISPVAVIAGRAARLADAFRDKGLPVFLVNVVGTAPGRTDHAPSHGDQPDGWTDLLPALGRRPDDHLLSKKTWGAFTGTDLAEQLDSMGVTQVLLAGIASSRGVQSTARQAHELGYNVLIAVDAVTDLDEDAHRASLVVFSQLGEAATTEEIVGTIAGRDP